MNPILFEEKDTIGYITLNRPLKYNALSFQLLKELQTILQQIKNNDNLEVIIINANGPHFCSGHDISELLSKNNYEEIKEIFQLCSDIMQTIPQLPHPVIASVQGLALAAGCQLAASCDLTIATDQAKFGTPGVHIGLFCYTPMVPISRIIGQKKALELLLTGKRISAREAEEIGLINKVVTTENLENETKNLATQLTRFSKTVITNGKHAFYHQQNMTKTKAYEFAVDQISSHCLSEDAQEGMKAVLEKRTPRWKP